MRSFGPDRRRLRQRRPSFGRRGRTRRPRHVRLENEDHVGIVDLVGHARKATARCGWSNGNAHDTSGRPTFTTGSASRLAELPRAALRFALSRPELETTRYGSFGGDQLRCAISLNAVGVGRAPASECRAALPTETTFRGAGIRTRFRAACSGTPGRAVRSSQLAGRGWSSSPGLSVIIHPMIPLHVVAQDAVLIERLVAARRWPPRSREPRIEPGYATGETFRP